MPFCTKCGTENEGKFCPACGAPTGVSAASAAPAVTAGDLDENVASALCYVLTILTGVLFLVLEPYSRNRTVRFHAFQSIFFFLAVFACNIGLFIMAMIPFIGWIISMIGYVLLPLAGFVVWIVLIIKAYQKERWVLPIIGPMAEKQA